MNPIVEHRRGARRSEDRRESWWTLIAVYAAAFAVILMLPWGW